MRSTASTILVGALPALGVLVACNAKEAPSITVTIEVVDEHGEAIPNVALEQDQGRIERTDDQGTATLSLSQPMVLVATGEALLAEPFAVGWGDDDTVMRVRVWRNPQGTRWSMHATGDVMFGRRYNFPTSGDPLIPPAAIAEGAVDVVAAIKRMYVAATVRTINLETVVSNLPSSYIYPGKRFILNSFPETLAAVKDLQVDVVSLANNHARDYLDQGVLETANALDAAGLTWLGASYDSSLGDEPVYLDVNGLKVGFLAWTTVDGDFVNDSYPSDTAVVPGDLDPDESWQYQKRSWGYSGPSFDAPVADRRIGGAWRLFRAAEATMDPADVAASWASLVAVYPELQDWVARRGHGGATSWTPASITKIQEAKASSDLVVAQFHAGFQFQPAPSAAVRDYARQAIDAGADIVICHHPHVLQGAEWYKGKLIIYSLGNFIFDQDFLSTYSSGILRTVWDGTELIEARFLPSEIVGYKPRPVTDLSSHTTIRRLWEMSMSAAHADRGGDGGVRVMAAELLPDTEPAIFRFERNSAVIAQGAPTPTTRTVRLDPFATVELPKRGLRLARIPDAADIDVGRELFQWGRFEDEFADDADTWGAHWALAAGRKFVEFIGGAVEGHGYLRLYRTAKNSDQVTARPVARVPLYQHRLYEERDGAPIPLDPTATYTMRAMVRRTGDGAAAFRLDLYLFDDTNPTEDPSSESIGTRTLEVDIPNDGHWHQVEVDVPESVFVSEDKHANMVMLYVALGVPERGETTFDIDKLSLVEWRDAQYMPAQFGLYDYLRSRRSTPIDVAVQEME